MIQYDAQNANNSEKRKWFSRSILGFAFDPTVKLPKQRPHRRGPPEQVDIPSYSAHQDLTFPKQHRELLPASLASLSTYLTSTMSSAVTSAAASATHAASKEIPPRMPPTRPRQSLQTQLTPPDIREYQLAMRESLYLPLLPTSPPN
jgi:hypothetical protein